MRWQSAITAAYSLIVSIVLMPPAMTLWGSYQNKATPRTQRWAAELYEMTEAVHRRHEANKAS